MSEYKFHVGLAPYADQSGTIRASYQVVGIDTGKAVATLSMVDGKVTQSIFGDGNYCRGSFIAMAKRHFSTATPNPDYRATIITDGRPPDSVVCWDSGGFYLRPTYE